MSKDRSHHICPYWVAHLFDNPLRRVIHPPAKVLSSYVQPGMTVLDFGSGLGHYSLGMARLVGRDGRVIAADVQQNMLNKVMSRARKAELADIISPYLCNGNGLSVQDEFDFALASNSLHETPNPADTLHQIIQHLKPGGRFLLMEPPGHLSPEDFEHEIELAQQVGFKKESKPSIRRSMSVLFSKP